MYLKSSAELRRYEERQHQYRQNKMFENNQRRLFEEIEGIERDNIIPDADESIQLWSAIWGQSVQYNEEA